MLFRSSPRNARASGKPVEYDPKLDVQAYNPEARALRGDGMKRTCPTWHGGVAHQPPADRKSVV